MRSHAVSTNLGDATGPMRVRDHDQFSDIGRDTLHVGLVWWTLGMFLALLYFVIMYWLFRGKVSAEAEGYGH